jgi:hypothetical protein
MPDFPRPLLSRRTLLLGAVVRAPSGAGSMGNTIFRPGPPELGIAQEVVHDAGLGKHPGVLFFMDCGSGRVADYINMSAPSWTDSPSYDWSGHDRTKLPWAQGDRLVWGPAPDLQAPMIVDERFREFGYTPLLPGSKAMMFSCRIGQETVVDIVRFFLPTKTGDQSLPYDPQGVLPQEMYLRWYQLIGGDMVVPPKSKRNGGKWGPGFSHHTSLCGNGGNFCNQTRLTPAGAGGRMGWTSRGQFILPNEPADPAYGYLLWGTYQYNALESQNDYMFGLPAHLPRGSWRCCEVYQKMNTIDRSGAVPARRDGIIRAWVDGKKCFEKDDFQWRLDPPWIEPPPPKTRRVVADGGILAMWWNTFFGGQFGGAPMANHHFVTNLVISTRYVGPMRMA